MNETTVVLPSARAIRHAQLKLESSTLFLPLYITISEFITKLCRVDGYTIADNDSRILMLLEASDFSQFSKLQIERNFFTFTKNSSYIFKFFEELSAEQYDIANLSNIDIYAEYEEHIEILQELYMRYEQLCHSKKIIDRIFLPKLYTFNKAFAKRLKNVELHVDGYLTNFEFELLEKCSHYANVDIFITTSRFNIKMQKKILELFNITLEPDFKYKISINQKAIREQSVVVKNTQVNCESFSEPLLQVAFVKKKIFDFIEKGYSAQKIAVILPDEKIANLLKSFDNESNLNFAMGTPFKETQFYKKLHATSQAIEQNSKENMARIDRISDDLYEKLQSIYYKKSLEVDLIDFLQKYKESFSIQEELKIFEQEIYSFKNILKYVEDMSVKSLLHMFLQRIASRTLDDVRGGKITVMGVLETRSVEYDAVIIIDFSDTNVPKRSDKDMFLNTNIREMASLPTMNDRENLQKHYYDILINRSKEVVISYVKSPQSSGSKFLKQLNIKQNNIYTEQEYAELLFKRSTQKARVEEDIILEYSFVGKKLSATRLKVFLECKRKYYYQYILHLSHHEIPKDIPQEYVIGTDVHKALSELYSKKSFYTDVESLKNDLANELEAARGDSEFEKYLINIQKRRMDLFAQREIQRFNEGWRVEFCEKTFECEYAGMTLTGQIDRIDKRGDERAVLDYKTGSYPLYTAKNFSEATDFQLEFYYLLAGAEAKVSECAYYDLKESKIVHELFLEEKLAVLESNIKDLLALQEVNFLLCEDQKHCTYCAYAIMCARD